MKRLVICFWWLWTVNPAGAAAPPCEVAVYAYDSFLSAKGIGPAVFAAFERRTGCRVRALAVGDGGQLVTRLQLDRKLGPTARADLIIGLDAASFARASEFLDPRPGVAPPPWAPDLAGLSWPSGFTPFDYGLFAFMADTSALPPAQWPRSLADLAAPRFRRRLILEDPRTSTPGLGFLLYVDQLRGAGRDEFWAALRPQWLTLAPGWDGAYGIFLKGEAPLVWSYVTSEAYHREHDPASERYRAVLFDEGQPIQVEGVALAAGLSEERRARARALAETLLSPEVQAELPRRQWMMPARAGIALPPSFARLPRAKKVVPPPNLSAAELKARLGDWARRTER